MLSATDIAGLIHGWNGLQLLYGAVQLSLLAGLIRGRAPLHTWPLSVLVAALLTAAVGASMVTVDLLLNGWNVVNRAAIDLTYAFGLSAAAGYTTGSRIARSAARAGRPQMSVDACRDMRQHGHGRQASGMVCGHGRSAQPARSRSSGRGGLEHE